MKSFIWHWMCALALVENAGACRGFALDMTFGGARPASYGQRPDIPIVDGSFRIIEPGSYDIRGTFDGDSATGEATFTGVASTAPPNGKPAQACESGRTGTNLTPVLRGCTQG
jgi:hypothetical protein